MKPMAGVIMFVILAGACMASTGFASAQETTGKPGSPDATTTIDGKYLPAPPPPFCGVINMGADNPSPAGLPR
jgi:arylsulfatase